MTFKLPKSAGRLFTPGAKGGQPMFTADQVLAAYEQGKAEMDLPSSYEGATFISEADGFRVTLHFKNAEAEEWFDRLTDRWDALKESASRAIQAPKEGESLRQCEACCGSGIIKHDAFNPTQSTCDCCNGEGRVTNEDLAAWKESL